MRFFCVFVFLIFFSASSIAQDGLYNPAYSNPYSSPMSTPGNGNGNGNNGNGNGNGNNGNGNANGHDKDKDKKNGVPLDTEAWALMLAGSAFGIWKVLSARKPA